MPLAGPPASRGAGGCGGAGAAGAGACFCAPNSSSSDIPSSLTIEYSVLTDGRDFPVSICEIALGETPSRRASSRRLRPRCSRCARSLGPTSSSTAAGPSACVRSGQPASPRADCTLVHHYLTERVIVTPMPELEFREAIREALDEELARDERVIFLGEDVAVAGGVFAVTPGLLEKHGPPA